MKRTSPQTNILLAGQEPAFADLALKFSAQGIAVVQASDGNLALQKALEVKPSLVMIDAMLTSIPAARFAQILRTNRQGNDLSIVFIGEEGEEIEGFVRHRDRFFARPLNVSQLAAFVEKHFRRIERAQQLLRQKQDVEGSLDQLSLADLLQLFGLNGKSGTLFLSRGVERGTVFLHNGQIDNARLGRVEGEKALYRLLLWESGTFRFSPGEIAAAARITAPTDHLIMEGLRLGDEIAEQAGRLPALQARMEMVIPPERLPQGLRPSTREILAKLESYPRVSDLLDHCSYADLQILQVLRVLREKGVISESRAESVEQTLPLVAATEILAVHQTLFGVARIGEALSAVLVVLSPSHPEVGEFLSPLHALPEFVASALLCDDPRLPSELGHLQLSENFALRILTLPATAEYSPLWSLYGRQIFGVVSLTSANAFPAAERIFSTFGSVVVSLDPQGRQALNRGGRGAVRDFLQQFLPPFQKNTRRPEVP